MSKIVTFRIGPKMGDTIFALLVVRKIAEINEAYARVYLDGYWNYSEWTYQMEQLSQLFSSQKYIDEFIVIKSGEICPSVDYDLDKTLRSSFDYWPGSRNIPDQIAFAFEKQNPSMHKLKLKNDDFRPWLNGIKPDKKHFSTMPIVCRSTRGMLPSDRVIDYPIEFEKMTGVKPEKIGFIGYDDELEILKGFFPEVNWVKIETNTLQDMASAIAGAQYFISNMTLGDALASAMGIPHTVEHADNTTACLPIATQHKCHIGYELSRIRKIDYSQLAHSFVSLFEVQEPQIEYSRVRIGCDGDGGYVLLTPGLQECDALYGYGSMSHEMAFDIDFQKKTGKTVHTMEPAFDMPPDIQTHNLKLGKISDHVDEVGGDEKNIIVRMDTEGEEWSFFEKFDDDDAKIISQIIIEFHDLCNEKLLKPRYESLKKFMKYFVPVHVHGNTRGPGPQKFFNDMFIPTLEVTFLNRSLCSFRQNTKISFPTSVDMSNNFDKEDYKLNFWPFLSNSNDQDKIEYARPNLATKFIKNSVSTPNRNNIDYFKQEICRMSPKLGDMIFALPLVRRVYEVTGKQVGLYLDAYAGGGGYEWIKLFEQCIPLVERQPYISWVKVVSSKQEHDNLEFTMDLEKFFRNCTWDYCHPGNYFNGLMENNKDYRFGKMIKERDLLLPWITGIHGDPEWNDYVIVSSSTRYCPKVKRMDYKKEIELVAPSSKIAFLGYDDEFREFKKQVPNLKFDKRIQAIDMVEMSKILLGAKYVCCNQSFPQTLCCALGVPHTSELPEYICTANLQIPCQKSMILP